MLDVVNTIKDCSKQANTKDILKSLSLSPIEIKAATLATGLLSPILATPKASSSYQSQRKT